MQRGLEFPKPTVDRRFWSILLLSVLLHAGVLAWKQGVVKDQLPALPPLMAILRAAVATPATPSEPLAQPSAAAVPQKARQQPARTEFRSAPLVTSSAGPANRVVPASEAAPPAEAPAVQQATPAVAVQVAPAARSQDELLAGYRRRLTELLARQQDYPRLAAMRGWEGEVKVRVRIARKGNLLDVAVDHSSGYEVLDKHAMGMVEGLGGLPSLPEDYGGNELQVVVPVNYRLRKST